MLKWLYTFDPLKRLFISQLPKAGEYCDKLQSDPVSKILHELVLDAVSKTSRQHQAQTIHRTADFFLAIAAEDPAYRDQRDYVLRKVIDHKTLRSHIHPKEPKDWVINQRGLEEQYVFMSGREGILEGGPYGLTAPYKCKRCLADLQNKDLVDGTHIITFNPPYLSASTARCGPVVTATEWIETLKRIGVHVESHDSRKPATSG